MAKLGSLAFVDGFPRDGVSIKVLAEMSNKSLIKSPKTTVLRRMERKAKFCYPTGVPWVEVRRVKKG